VAILVGSDFEDGEPGLSSHSSIYCSGKTCTLALTSFNFINFYEQRTVFTLVILPRRGRKHTKSLSRCSTTPCALCLFSCWPHQPSLNHWSKEKPRQDSSKTYSRVYSAPLSNKSKTSSRASSPPSQTRSLTNPPSACNHSTNAAFVSLTIHPYQM
jgi:hypothetical protein